MCHCLLIVNHAIDEWRCHLSACLDAEGGHFEHYLWRAPKIGVSHWLGLSPLQQFSTTVLTVIATLSQNNDVKMAAL